MLGFSWLSECVFVRDELELWLASDPCQRVLLLGMNCNCDLLQSLVRVCYCWGCIVTVICFSPLSECVIVSYAL